MSSINVGLLNLAVRQGVVRRHAKINAASNIILPLHGMSARRMAYRERLLYAVAGANHARLG